MLALVIFFVLDYYVNNLTCFYLFTYLIKTMLSELCFVRLTCHFKAEEIWVDLL
uniref:Uncharacterized protein n=1 Tax=Anguilla anguilla TaxID=7936 RepID=A0A0E9WZ06_ANGAN